MPYVSSATVFVSHAWRYSFYDVVVDVMEQHAKEHPETYFWFDLFTNNQNEVYNKDYDWFSTTFSKSIGDIGQVLLVLSPWNDPIPIRRAWCLFEIHNALAESEVKLHVNLPSGEIDELRKGVIEDSECVVQALADIQAEKAEAKNDYERDMIFDVIRESRGGFLHVNKQIKEGLRSWYIEQLQSLNDKEGDNSTLLMHTANVMRSFGFYDSALQLYKKTLAIRISTSGEKHPSVAASYSNMATVYKDIGELDLALEYFSNALTIMLATLGDQHADVVQCYNNIANVYYSKGQFEKALEYHHKSLTIRLKTLGDNHPAVATAYNNIANVYFSQKDYDKSLQYHHKSLTIRLNTSGENHPHVAVTYMGMANVYDSKGEHDKSLEYYNKSLAIRLSTLGENHPDVASLYFNMAAVYQSKEDMDKALEFYNKSLSIRVDTLGESHPSVASCYKNIAIVYRNKNQLDKAFQYYHKTVATIGLHGQKGKPVVAPKSPPENQKKQRKMSL